MALSGKRVLVTGGTSGIGRATAEAFAREGATVIVSGRDEARGSEVVAAIRARGGSADFVAAELADPEAVRRLAEHVGEVDVLVNNAGVFSFAPTEATAESDFDAQFAVNVKAPFLLTAALAPKMAANGGGAIVNVTTMAAELGLAGMAAYGASKAALTLLTKAWAAEYGPRGVRVNAVSPGPVRTPGTAAMGDGLDQIASTLPVGRAADPHEIAEAAVFLASEEASFIHGAVLAVDGGRTAV